MRLTSEDEARLGAWQKVGSGVRDVLFGRSDVTWEQARHAYVDRMEALMPPPASVYFQNTTLDGAPTILATPEGPEQDRVLLYLHGEGSLALHSMLGRLPLIGSSARRLVTL